MTENITIRESIDSKKPAEMLEIAIKLLKDQRKENIHIFSELYGVMSVIDDDEKKKIILNQIELLSNHLAETKCMPSLSVLDLLYKAASLNNWKVELQNAILKLRDDIDIVGLFFELESFMQLLEPTSEAKAEFMRSALDSLWYYGIIK